MTTLKTAFAIATLFAALASPSAAERTIWDQIRDSAPLHPVFETLRDNAP